MRYVRRNVIFVLLSPLGPDVQTSWVHQWLEAFSRKVRLVYAKHLLLNTSSEKWAPPIQPQTQPNLACYDQGNKPKPDILSDTFAKLGVLLRRNDPLYQKWLFRLRKTHTF